MRVIGLAGWSGSGKTTLLARLIPVLVGLGVRVSTVKHAHHTFEVDRAGKDSYVHRQAGAVEVMVGSSARWALMHELRGEAEPGLATLLGRMGLVDLVVVEGFKREGHRKIEVYREVVGKPLLHPGDGTIVGGGGGPGDGGGGSVRGVGRCGGGLPGWCWRMRRLGPDGAVVG